MIRDAVADVVVSPSDLILPLFISDAEDDVPVASLPGVEQLCVRSALRTMHDLSSSGLKQFMLFGVTVADKKDSIGSYAADPDAPVNRTMAAARDGGLDVLLYADLCFCEYTDHGHCGVLGGDSATVDNDRTLERLAITAKVQADRGADVIAPSGMMDGQVAAVRAALDGARHGDVAILSYAVKYASAFYGPFREAGGCRIASGDRSGYQMDHRRRDEWRAEISADIAEGADMVMVKPAAGYLDVLRGVKGAATVPVAAYHVSGEYAMLHAAAERGWIDFDAALLEVTHAIKRAGADQIVTYAAPRLLGLL